LDSSPPRTFRTSPVHPLPCIQPTQTCIRVLSPHLRLLYLLRRRRAQQLKQLLLPLLPLCLPWRTPLPLSTLPPPLSTLSLSLPLSNLPLPLSTLPLSLPLSSLPLLLSTLSLPRSSRALPLSTLSRLSLSPRPRLSPSPFPRLPPPAQGASQLSELVQVLRVQVLRLEQAQSHLVPVASPLLLPLRRRTTKSPPRRKRRATRPTSSSIARSRPGGALPSPLPALAFCCCAHTP